MVSNQFPFLQGHYAFVIFDNHRKQVFAARDPSGTEDLFFCEEGGSVSFTNTLNNLPEEVNPDDWMELPPGHFISGKVPTLQQFALTPDQLALRERHESMEAPDILDEDPPSMADPVICKLGRHSKLL